jgi:integrase
LLKNEQHADVRTWVAELSASGLAPATVAKGNQILAKILRAAVDDRRIPVNPADRVPLPRVERDEMRFLDPTEVQHLADSIDPRYRGFVLLGAYSGLRLGEMLGLRWKHTDLLRRRVVFGPPKTRAAARTVPIPSIVADALAALTHATWACSKSGAVGLAQPETRSS